LLPYLATISGAGMTGYVQDERYIAMEYMDVRRDCVNFALRHSGCATPSVSPCPHSCLVRPQLSSGGAGTDIVLPGHGTSTSL
jgi:hypothetical protein